MSQWSIKRTRGAPVLAHVGREADWLESVRDDIEEAERQANAAGRTLVFVNLGTPGGSSYYYPLQFLPRLSEYAQLAVGPGCEYQLWRDPGYQQKRTALSDDSNVDYQSGTTTL